MASPQFEQKDILVFSEFEGMNTQSDRHDLDEKKSPWLENVQPIGKNNLVQVPAPAPAKTNIAGEVISEEFFAPINSKNYLICFCQSGSAYAVDLSNGNQTKFAHAGTFSQSPDCTVWNLQRILITDSQAGYCTWDGTVFVQSGGVSPNIQVTAGGTGYTSAPTVTISGGSGTGATATAVITGGVVTAVNLTNPGTGYKSGDTLTVAFSGGGGTGATATAHIWPTITPKATTIAVYQGRVWLAQSNIITYTGTGATYGGVGYDDFLTGDASGTFTITDTDLVRNITALRNLNNYLYVIGDNSVKQIGNISVNSTTNSTGFTIVTLSSDQGTSFRNTIVSYNRLLLFTNTVGVYAVFGTSVEKISDEMDGIFRLVDFTLAPSAAVNDINNIHCFLLLVRYKDPFLGITRSLILCFMNKKWFVISQGNNITYIVTVSINGVTETYSTSGSDVTQLLEDFTVAVNIKIQTSLTSHEQPYFSKRIIRYAISQTASANNTLQLLVESERSQQQIAYVVKEGIQFINNAGVNITFIGTGNVPINFFAGAIFQYQPGNTTGVSGIYLGMTLTGSVIGFSLNSMMIEYGTTAAFAATSVSIGQV